MAKKKAKQHEFSDIEGLKVSQSRVKTWRKCHYAHYNRYVRKLRKKIKSRPLQFGTIVHSMLEADAEGDNPFSVLKKIEKDNKKLFRTEREMYGEIINDVRQIMTEYFNYWPEKDLRPERRNGKSGEHSFAIELIDFKLPGVVWIGKIDQVGKTPNKLRWAVEHKTFSRKPNDDERWRNLQSASYIRAIDMLGWGSVDGMCWDYIRSKSPAVPGVLQNGEMSQKNIDTLPITVRETISDLGFEEKDYKSLIGRAEEGLSVWFQRIHAPVNTKVVDSVFNDFIFSIRELVDHGETYLDKCIDRHCSWCDYEAICRAELQGDDVEYVIQRDYERDKDGDKKEINVTDSTE